MLLIYIYLPEVSSYAMCMFTFLRWNIVNNYNSLCNCQFFIFMYMCLIFFGTRLVGASLVAQTVRNMPAIQETRVWSLRSEDSLEKGMATHSGILAWRIPCTEEPVGLQSIGSQRERHDWATLTFKLYLKATCISTCEWSHHSHPCSWNILAKFLPAQNLAFPTV